MARAPRPTRPDRWPGSCLSPRGGPRMRWRGPWRTGWRASWASRSSSTTHRARGARRGPRRHRGGRVGERGEGDVEKPIIIDNAPGAGGTVGTAKASRAAADGYTMLVGHMGYMGAAPALYKKLAYDPVKDFAPVFRFPDTPLVLMVRKEHPAKDI